MKKIIDVDIENVDIDIDKKICIVKISNAIVIVRIKLCLPIIPYILYTVHPLLNHPVNY